MLGKCIKWFKDYLWNFSNCYNSFVGKLNCPSSRQWTHTQHHYQYTGKNWSQGNKWETSKLIRMQRNAIFKRIQGQISGIKSWFSPWKCANISVFFLDNNYIFFSLFLVFFFLPEKATFRRSQHSLCLSFFVTAFFSLSSSVSLCVCVCQTALLFKKNAIFSSRVFLSLN